MSSPAASTPHAVRRADTEARLLQSAIDVLADEGFAAASLATVAGRAGLTTGAVQRRFGTKSEMLVAVYEAILDAEMARLPDAFERHLAAQSQPSGLVRALWRAFDTGAMQVVIELERASRSDGLLREAVTRRRSESAEVVINAFQRALGASVTDDPAFAPVASTVALALRGLAMSASLLRPDEIERVVYQLGVVADAMLKPA